MKYIETKDIYVGLWSYDTGDYIPVDKDDATYPWELDGSNLSTVKFLLNPPPAPQAIGFENLLIYRDTDIEEINSVFYPANTIRSSDLNDNFEQVLFSAQELQTEFSLLESNAITFLGTIDLTVDEAPANPNNGNYYVNTGDGTVLDSWTGIGGETVIGSEQVIYNSSILAWELLAVPASKFGVTEVSGTAPIIVDNTNKQTPIVGITAATQSDDGSLSAADKTKLDNYPAVPPNGTTIGPTPPPNPVASDQWWDSTDGRGYVYYEDVDSGQWVEMNPSWNGSVPPDTITTDKIVDGAVTPDKLDRVYLEPGQEAITQLVAGSNVSLSPSSGKGVVTINSTGGGGGGGTTVNYNGASAWANVAADGTLNGNDNIASVSKSSAGVYSVTFKTPMPNANYSVVGSVNGNSSYVFSSSSQSTTGFTANTVRESSTDKDFSFAVFASNAIAPPSGVGADAWGNIEADGTINNSFNVASVTNPSTGTYSVVFVTPMPTADYSAQVTGYSNNIFVPPQNQSKNGFTYITHDNANNATNVDASFTVHASSTVTPTYTWTRDGTTLKPANDGDNVEIGGTVDITDGTGTIELNKAGLIRADRTTTTAGLFQGQLNGTVTSSTFCEWQRLPC